MTHTRIMETAVEVCPECDIAGCHHLRAKQNSPSEQAKRLEELEAERSRLDELSKDDSIKRMFLEYVSTLPESHQKNILPSFERGESYTFKAFEHAIKTLVLAVVTK